MYFDVLINGKRRATVGHDRLEHLSVSVASCKDASSLFATAICDEPDDKYSLIWLNEDLGPKDVVSIVPSRVQKASRPIRRRRMRAGQRSTAADGFCDFCKRSEPEVRRVIEAGDSPAICNECVDLCRAILEDAKPGERARPTASRTRRR